MYPAKRRPADRYSQAQKLRTRCSTSWKRHSHGRHATHRIEAEIDVAADDHGVLVCFGNSAGGYVLFLKSGRLVYAYNHCGDVTRLVSTAPLAPGRHTVAFSFRKAGMLAGTGRLSIDGNAAGERFFDKTLLRISLAPMLIGRSGLPPVVDDYTGDFRFSGVIDRVTFEIDDDRELAPPDGGVD